MVSFWLWRNPDNSPASFEKTLSTLSSKISLTTSRLDAQRQRARRFRALWTLYASFTYLIYSLILGLGLGWQHWGPIEYTAVSGGPVVIYLVRAGIDTYYQYRISNTQKTLDELQKQRASTIEKLKEATKYNSTQQLLEKYGAEPNKPSSKNDPNSGRGKGGAKRRDPKDRASLPFPPGRTGLPPPPTANIRRVVSGSLPTTPNRSPQPPQNIPQIPPNLNAHLPQQPHPASTPQQQHLDEPGFAPNAFPMSQQYAGPQQPRWYDRVLDVLLGEDETLAKNRLALVCTQCRLVNGQAPPGIRTLEDLGRWRCGACGVWNGEISESKKALDDLNNEASQIHIRKRSQSHPLPRPPVILEPTSTDEEDAAEGSGSNVAMSASEAGSEPKVQQDVEEQDEPEEGESFSTVDKNGNAVDVDSPKIEQEKITRRTTRSMSPKKGKSKKR